MPSGIDEQGVDHGGLLLRLSHLPAADATQRRLELVGEGEVVAPQLKVPAPPRRRVGAAEAVGEGIPPLELIDGVLDVLEVVAEPPRQAREVVRRVADDLLLDPRFFGAPEAPRV